MVYRIEFNCMDVDWDKVYEVIKGAGLKAYSKDLIRKAFENSEAKVFIYDGDTLIGVGRGISDGAYQAAIYDIAVLPDYHGKGIGKTIMEELHRLLGDVNIILYANVTAENFYRKLGYSKMLTGMAKFKDADGMRKKGFID